jgi:hypothetical protein
MSAHRCPECDHECATFGSLVAHLRCDHGVMRGVERYGPAE